MTTVFNLLNLDEYVYDLPPEKAVVAAYRQYVLKDMNWWIERKDVPTVENYGIFVTCGDFTAKKG